MYDYINEKSLYERLITVHGQYVKPLFAFITVQLKFLKIEGQHICQHIGKLNETLKLHLKISGNDSFTRMTLGTAPSPPVASARCGMRWTCPPRYSQKSISNFSKSVEIPLGGGGR